MGKRGRAGENEVAESTPPWNGASSAIGAIEVPRGVLAEGLIELDPETEGINTWAESALHASLKTWLARPGDRLEVSVHGRVVDLLRSNGECVEVQTKRLDKIAPKVLALARRGPVRIVHPIVAESTIARLDPLTGELLSERRSPKRGKLWSIFDELVMAPALIGARNVTVEVLLVRSREIRVRDAKWTWRKKGDRLLSRDLVEVIEARAFKGRRSWLDLLPRGLAFPCDSSSLGEALGIGAEGARKLLYSYAKAGLLVEAGLRGRRKLYDRAPARAGAAKGRSAAADLSP